MMDRKYILAPKAKKGDQVESGGVVPVKDGNCMEIGNMPDGAIVHNVELSPGKGGVSEIGRIIRANHRESGWLCTG